MNIIFVTEEKIKILLDFLLKEKKIVRSFACWEITLFNFNIKMVLNLIPTYITTLMMIKRKNTKKQIYIMEKWNGKSDEQKIIIIHLYKKK